LLKPTDILEILRQNHSVANPVAFVEKATNQGIDDLLKNPQTLGLLAQAIKGDRWPETRQETFELACMKLADEASKPHRDQLRARPVPIDAILDSAGQLFAVLLLSDKTGIALDQAASDDRFPALEEFSPPKLDMARWATRRSLFRPSASSEERVIPSHRSIAEYLAARCLAQQIDSHGFSLGRLLNLLVGKDGRTVAGLRGLYGWLALHCHVARSSLIDADPLTVVIYGDVKPMSRADKQRILTSFKREAEQHTAFRWEVQTNHPFGALADPELVADFISALESPERSDAAQSFADCVLEILAEGSPLPALEATVKKVVIDEFRWGRTRTCALRVWLKVNASIPDAMDLLDAITNNEIADSNDELAGILLNHLYQCNTRCANRTKLAAIGWTLLFRLARIQPHNSCQRRPEGLSSRLERSICWRVNRVRNLLSKTTLKQLIRKSFPPPEVRSLGPEIRARRVKPIAFSHRRGF
jgi:hypothetical protein